MIEIYVTFSRSFTANFVKTGKSGNSVILIIFMLPLRHIFPGLKFKFKKKMFNFTYIST